MNKLLQISHTDLDGIGSAMSPKIFSNKNNLNYILFNIGYEDIIPTLQNINQWEKLNFITDLNFNSNDLSLLKMIVENNPDKKFFYFDHHQYTEDELSLLNEIDKNSNFRYIIDKTRCATKITYNFFIEKNLINYNENLDKLITLIDTYDLWKKDDPLFKKAFLLDKVFWSVNNSSSMWDFLVQYQKNNWVMPEHYKRLAQKMIEKKINDYKIFEENNVLVKGRHTFVIPSVEWINDVKFDYPGFAVYIGFNPGKQKVSIRIDENRPGTKSSIIKYLKETIPEKLIGVGGHEFAFGIALNNDVDNLEVVKMVYEYCEDSIKE
jgi:hypothetical protein